MFRGGEMIDIRCDSCKKAIYPENIYCDDCIKTLQLRVKELEGKNEILIQE